MREQVAQPVDAVDTVNAAARRPRLLAVPIQAVDGDDTAVELAANAQKSSKKHTRQSGWCLLLPLAGRVQLQQLALLTLRMLRGLQEACLCVSVHETEG